VAQLTVTADRRWSASSRAIVSALGLSGVLSSLLSPDVILDTAPKPGGWILVSARSSDPDELLEVWLCDYGGFTEALLNFKARARAPILARRQLKGRLDDFCDQLENALSADAGRLARKNDPIEQVLGKSGEEHVTKELHSRPTALFQPIGRLFRPSAATLGPWDARVLHGGPVAGLLAHGILSVRADPEISLVRLTVDMPRAVPAEELELTATVLREGRRVVVAEASVSAQGKTFAWARGLLLRSSSEPAYEVRQEQPSISALSGASPIEMPAEPIHHANSIELRRADHGAVWVGVDIALVEGMPLDPVERAAIASDWANPAANFGPDGIGYINPDITLYLHRPPMGTWLGVGPSARGSTTGLAVSDCPIADAVGVVGHCLAAGLGVGFTTKAPGPGDERFKAS